MLSAKLSGPVVLGGGRSPKAASGPNQISFTEFKLDARASIAPTYDVLLPGRPGRRESHARSDLNGGLKLMLPTPVPRLWLAPFINYSRSLNRDLFAHHAYGAIGVTLK
jgi:hypothetical protein